MQSVISGWGFRKLTECLFVWKDVWLIVEDLEEPVRPLNYLSRLPIFTAFLV